MTRNQNVPAYTGDIAAQQVTAPEYSTENQELLFSEEQHAIWADLFADRAGPNVVSPYKVCEIFPAKNVFNVTMDVIGTQGFHAGDGFLYTGENKGEKYRFLPIHTGILQNGDHGGSVHP